jgi:hypothetical protein
MKIYAPDTNFFLQCQPPGQINWRLVTSDDEVVLLVVREVRKELDRLKSGGNQRRSKRARSASASLRRFTAEGVNEVELRATQPRVVLRIAPRPAEDEYPSGFRIESSDERIVAEAYAALAAIGTELTFLSHDTVPLEDATGLGLRIQVIPEEWLLNPEPSDVERELGDFKRRIKALEGRTPKIDVKVPTTEGRVILSAKYFPPLSNTFIADAMREIRKHYPVGPNGLGSNDTIGAAILFQETTDEHRWTQYAEDHSKWLNEVEELLNDVPRFLNDDPRATSLSLSIANDGTVGAENLIVRIDARGDFHLADPDDLDDESERTEYFPKPPVRPRKFFAALQGLARAQTILQRPINPKLFMPRLTTPSISRDRHAIYWEYENGQYSAHIEGQCQDFRHGLRPVELTFFVERTVTDAQPVQGAIEVLVSAGNLVETHRQTYPLSIEPDFQDPEKWVREVLRRELQVKI